MALSVVLTLWFLSGIVMMHWGYPSLDREDYLRRTPPLDATKISPSVSETLTRAEQPPVALTLTSFDDRPVYYEGAAMIYADDGSRQGAVDQAMMDRAATTWTGRPLNEATRTVVRDVDQWTLGDGMRSLMPLVKYSWSDGQQVYVDGNTADVVQYTTRASRLWA